MLYDSPVVFQLATVASFCLVALVIYWGRKPAEVLGLVDKPDARKQHKGHVPLLGGIGIALALMALVPLTINNSHINSIVAITLLITLLGVVDDVKELSARFRFLCQLTAGVLLALWAEVRIVDLGNVLGFGQISFNYFWSAVFTAFCAVGVINAINMIDGIDGLFGGTTTITMLAIAYLGYHASQPEILLLCLIVIGGLGAFLAFNLGVFGPEHKVFAGDSGSMAIGFLIAAILVFATQGSDTVLNPVAAGWLVGLPLIDTVAVMTKRVIKGKSPFAAGRDHFHHQLLDAGLSPIATLAVILGFQSLAVAGGFFAISKTVPDAAMFWLFVVITVFHFFFSQRIINKIKRQ